MDTEERGVLVIYKSENGRDDWQPVKTADVPEWILHPEVLGRIVNGEACMDSTSPSGTDWFMARYVMTEEDAMIVNAAQEKRSGVLH